MANLSQQATIKYKVDSTQAVAQTRQLSQAQKVMANQTAPAMTSSFGALGGSVTDLTGASDKLGFSLSSALGPAFGLVGNALAAVNPVVLAATVAAAAAAAAYLAWTRDAKDFTDTIGEAQANLETLAESSNKYAGVARELLEIRRLGLAARQAEIEAEVALIQSGQRSAETMDYIKSAAIGTATAMAAILFPAMTLVGVQFDEVQEKIRGAIDTVFEGLVDINPEQQTEALIEAGERLGKVIGELDALGDKSKETSVDLLRLREGVLKLKEGLAEDLGGASAEQLQVFYEERRAIIEDAAAQELEKVQGNAEAEALIKEALHLRLEELRLAHSEQMASFNELDAIVVETTAARMLKTWANTFKAQENLLDRAARIQQNFMTAGNKAFAEAQQGRISIAQAAAKMVILAVADEVAQELEIRAKLWIAQAIAAAASWRFDQSAMYLAAAAAAFAGAAFVRGAAESAFIEEPEPAARDDEALAGSPEAETERRGSTVVSEGPLTLNYQATQIINGSVYAVDELFDLWQDFNEDQLRSAGGDARQRTRSG